MYTQDQQVGVDLAGNIQNGRRDLAEFRAEPQTHIFRNTLRHFCQTLLNPPLDAIDIEQRVLRDPGNDMQQSEVGIMLFRQLGGIAQAGFRCSR